MDETFRMLGREHEADLEREARTRQLAAEAAGPSIEPREKGDQAYEGHQADARPRCSGRSGSGDYCGGHVGGCRRWVQHRHAGDRVEARAAGTCAGSCDPRRGQRPLPARARPQARRHRGDDDERRRVVHSADRPVPSPRVVPADNRIYFALLGTQQCPYQARSASWPALAVLPRRQALELAIRTFLETSASLVVVALPTAKPIWLVFERDDLFADVDAQALRGQLASRPALLDAGLRQLIDQSTRPRLFIPLALVPVASGRETFEAISLFAP